METLNDCLNHLKNQYPSPQQVFKNMDKEFHGYLTLEDFKIELSEHIQNEDLLLELFNHFQPDENDQVSNDNFVQILDQSLEVEQEEQYHSIENSNEKSQNSAIEQGSPEQDQDQEEQEQEQVQEQEEEQENSQQQHNDSEPIQQEESIQQDNIQEGEEVEAENKEEINRKKEQILNIFDLPASPIKCKINEFKQPQTSNYLKSPERIGGKSSNKNRNTVYQISRDLKNCDTLSALAQKYNACKVDQKAPQQSQDNWSNLITSQQTFTLTQTNQSPQKHTDLLNSSQNLGISNKHSRIPSNAQNYSSKQLLGDYATPSSKMVSSTQNEERQPLFMQESAGKHLGETPLQNFFDISHKNIFQSQKKSSQKKNPNNLSSEKQKSIEKFFHSKSPQEQLQLLDQIKPKKTDNLEHLSLPISWDLKLNEPTVKENVNNPKKQKLNQFKSYLNQVWSSNESPQNQENFLNYLNQVDLQSTKNINKSKSNATSTNINIRRALSPTLQSRNQPLSSQLLSKRGKSQNKSQQIILSQQQQQKNLQNIDINNIYKEKLNIRQNNHILKPSKSNQQKPDIFQINIDKHRHQQQIGNDFDLKSTIPLRTYNLQNFKISPKNNKGQENTFQLQLQGGSGSLFQKKDSKLGGGSKGQPFSFLTKNH